MYLVPKRNSEPDHIVIQSAFCSPMATVVLALSSYLLPLSYNRTIVIGFSFFCLSLSSPVSSQPLLFEIGFPSVAQPGLKLNKSSALASQELRLQVYNDTLGW